MDFRLFDGKIGDITVSITVHIGPYALSVEEYRGDGGFEREHSMQGISLSKIMAAAGVADTEELRSFMLTNYATEHGADDFARFLDRHHLRCDHSGTTNYN